MISNGLQEDEAPSRPGSASRVSVEEMLEQLQITQSELENVRVSTLLSLHWLSVIWDTDTVYL